MKTDLAEATWPQVVGVDLVLVPLGSVEQHGPHLPFETDSVIAEAVASAVADEVAAAEGAHVVVVPALKIGASGEHQSFAGTCSIGAEALRVVLVELVRSIRTWASRVVIVNGHGGNLAALAAAVRQLRTEGHDVAWVGCAVDGGDAHAGFAETSLMLHLAPQQVRPERAEAGNVAPLSALMERLEQGGVGAVSPNGVLGDPAGATADEGARMFSAMVESLLARVRSGSPTEAGMLRGVSA